VPYLFPMLAFATVVVDGGWLEHLEPEDLDEALAEIRRVSSRSVLVGTSGRLAAPRS